MAVDAIDVSYWQGYVDFDAVRASGCTVAVIKATDGNINYPDHLYPAREWENARRTMDMRGLYHWLAPRASVSYQVNQFTAEVDRLGGLRDNEFAVLDVEQAGINSTQVYEWLDRVTAYYQRPAVLYTYSSFAASNLQDRRLLNFPIWLAHYTNGDLWIPGVFNEVPICMWQYSSDGNVPGVSGRCDVNRILDWAQLRQAAKAGPPPIPNPNPVPELGEDDVALQAQDQDGTIWMVSGNFKTPILSEDMRVQLVQMGFLQPEVISVLNWTLQYHTDTRFIVTEQDLQTAIANIPKPTG